MVWIEEANELVTVLALAAVGLATSLGNLLRLATVGSAGVAARSLADRALGTIMATESAPQVVVGYNDFHAVRVVVGAVGVV